MDRTIATDKGKIVIRHHDRGETSDAVRELVSGLLGKPFAEITHTAKGKPLLKDEPGIGLSVSHTTGWIAVYLSENASCGIDIEAEHRDISRAAPHFINVRERGSLVLTDETLHLVWGAKEAIYKCLGGEIGRLEEEVTVTRIDPSKRTIHALTPQGEMTCGYEVFAGNFIVWV